MRESTKRKGEREGAEGEGLRGRENVKGTEEVDGGEMGELGEIYLVVVEGNKSPDVSTFALSLMIN